MRVAVVTPYFREADRVLRQCLDSVAAQTHPATHFLVADGFPRDLVRDRIEDHIVLPHAHGDNGNFARCTGGLSAAVQGFDAIAFLDADNWFTPDHIAVLVELQTATQAELCTASRSIHRLDGSMLFPLDWESDGENFCDTSCYLFLRPAFHLLPFWALTPRQTSPITDRLFWAAVLARNITRAHSARPTVGFRSQYANHYRRVGEALPPGAKEPEDNLPAIAAWNALTPEARRRLLEGV